MAGHHPIVIFIRSHIFPEFVADTIDAVRFYADCEPLIVVTVDRNEDIEKYLRPAYPELLYYTSKSDCGWGGGLFRLFCESVCWLCRTQEITFDYLWNIDYDLIPIKKGFETYFQERFDSPRIGQIGKYNPNSAFWKRRVRMQLGRLKSVFLEHGKVWPREYVVGDHVAGACGVFKGTCVAQMLSSGFLDSPFRDLGALCKLADDPMLSLMTAAAGYTFREMGEKAYIKWHMTEDYRKIPDRGYYLYHPTKLVPGNQSYPALPELMCRNFFRQLRGQKPITMLSSSPAAGRPKSVLC